jgi:hypothetical protein
VVEESVARRALERAHGPGEASPPLVVDDKYARLLAADLGVKITTARTAFIGEPVTIARADLERLIERSTVVLDQNTHRLIHESDWRRWGRRGGLATFRRYGSSWMALLALRRWDRISPAELEAARPLR